MQVPTIPEQEALRAYIGKIIDITIREKGTLVDEEGIPQRREEQTFTKTVRLEHMTYNMLSGTLLYEEGIPIAERHYALPFLCTHFTHMTVYDTYISAIAHQGKKIYTA
ncbi:MAG: hypothetical protein ABIJ21_07070 [Nanoarchaeota archaeon]